MTGITSLPPESLASGLAGKWQPVEYITSPTFAQAPFQPGPTHQNFPWLKVSKRGGAEIAETFAEKNWIDCHGTGAISILNHPKP
jgi:hypothetical protein